MISEEDKKRIKECCKVLLAHSNKYLADARLFNDFGAYAMLKEICIAIPIILHEMDKGEKSKKTYEVGQIFMDSESRRHYLLTSTHDGINNDEIKSPRVCIISLDDLGIRLRDSFKVSSWSNIELPKEYSYLVPIDAKIVIKLNQEPVTRQW